MRSILDFISKKLFIITALFLISFSVFASVDVAKLIVDSRAWIILLILVWEYVLGKTKVVKPNSTIDLIISILKTIFGIKDEDVKF